MLPQVVGRVKIAQNGVCSRTIVPPPLCLLLIVSLGICTGCTGVSAVGRSQAANNLVGTTITPTSASVVSGGTLQFSAAVSGANQSAVIWSTSEGSISSAGLFTAPLVSSASTVTVVATSLANKKSTGIALVTVTPTPVTPPPPFINTTSLPSGTEGIGYSATLQANGGQAPYQWAIADGSLPTGIQLNTANGRLSGTPSVVEESSFVAQVTDKNGRSAQQSLSIAVAAGSGVVCGPPRYPCSRSDFSLIIPTTPPQLGSNPKYYGGHSGAGMVAIDPAYGNRILRVTDGNTQVSAPGMSFGTSWSAEANLISSDESMLFVTTEGNAPCLFEFDPAAFKATYQGCHYDIGNMQFGYTSADESAFYSYSGPYLYRFLINRTNWEYSSDTSFNQGKGYFNPDGHECLDGQLAAEQWYVQDTSLSSDDLTFAAMMGPEQDVDPYVVIWNASKGCRWINVKTWEVSAGWNTGLSNPIKITWVSGHAPTGPGGMHNVELDRSGQYAILAINGTSLPTKVFWDVDSNTVNDTCIQCWSHWACDFGVCFWAFGPPDKGPVMRDLSIVPFADMSSMMGQRDLPLTPLQPTLGTDEHAAHQNASTSQKNIYLLEESWDSGSFSVGGLWDDELIGVNWDGSMRTVRFNKTWSSGFAGCPISRLGHYAICSSDYQMYNRDKGFGSGLNEDTCDATQNGGHGTHSCRHDVLLFELR